jgi:hypothetical protein
MQPFHRYEGPKAVDIKVSAHGDRRTLEMLYLELCDLAKQNGLKVEWRLARGKPEEQADFSDASRLSRAPSPDRIER